MHLITNVIQTSHELREEAAKSCMEHLRFMHILNIIFVDIEYIELHVLFCKIDFKWFHGKMILKLIQTSTKLFYFPFYQAKKKKH